MPWTQVTGVTFPPGAHLWTREPHYDTPALCGEWKQDAEVRRVKDGTDMETLEAYLTEACNDKDTCAECLERARELYLSTSVESEISTGQRRDRSNSFPPSSN